MKKHSLFTSDRCAGFATKLKGACEMFQGSLINRLARSVASLVLVAAIGHLTAARVAGQATPPTHEAILESVDAVQTTVNTIGPKVDAVQTTVNTIGPKVDAVQTTVNTIETKVDNINAKLDLIPPAWSQILPATDRFQGVLGRAGVLDKETGLVWEHSPDTNMRNWSNAQRHCITGTVGGRKGWRLPTIQELASLIDPTIPFPGPTLPTGHPFGNIVGSSDYWSASTSADDAADAWNVSLDTGFVILDVKTRALHVWCVRGGQGVDPQ